MAERGDQGLALAATAGPAAILLDFTMPGMDDLATAHVLRGNPATAGIPIILMSAGIRLRAYRDTALVDGILPKPFTLEAVTRSVEAVR